MGFDRSVNSLFHNRRLLYPILVALLVLAAGATLFISNTPSPALPAAPTAVASGSMHVYLMDVAGWYEITPQEIAAASPFDLGLGSMKSLPAQVGPWSGQPYDYGSAVEQWFENPDLALASSFSKGPLHEMSFSAFGSLGGKSYVLFEHTPITSYPAAGWSLLDNRVVEIPTTGGSLRVNRALLTRDADRRLVYYWYLWPDTARDPARGVITMRLHVSVLNGDSNAEADAQEFLRALFPEVLPWHRF